MLTRVLYGYISYILLMPIPDGYTNLLAHRDSIKEARQTKEDLELTWNQFLEKAAEELTEA